MSKFLDLLCSDKEINCNLIIGGVDMSASFVWDKDSYITDYGIKKFKPIVDAEYTLLKNGNIEIHCNDDKLGEEFCLAAAGYIGAKEYDRLFKANESIKCPICGGYKTYVRDKRRYCSWCQALILSREEYFKACNSNRFIYGVNDCKDNPYVYCLFTSTFISHILGDNYNSTLRKHFPYLKDWLSPYKVLVSYLRISNPYKESYKIITVWAESPEDAFQKVNNYEVKGMFDDIRDDYIDDSLEVIRTRDKRLWV